MVRLNTTSDIPWEIHKIFDLFPRVQFYDYTKIKKPIKKPPNGGKKVYDQEQLDIEMIDAIYKKDIQKFIKY